MPLRLAEHVYARLRGMASALSRQETVILSVANEVSEVEGPSFNPRVAGIQTSLIRQIAARKRPSSIDLGLGEPTLAPTMAYFEAALEDVRERGVRYTLNAGDPALRSAIANYYAYPDRDAENVCITVGSQEAMYATLLTLLDAQRDELLVVEPTFPTYAKVAALHGVAVRSVAMSESDGFAFDAERIIAGIGERTRAIALCSPCNPTGRTISQAQAEALVRALERRGGEIALIHDEIYREQRYGADVDLARLYSNTVAVNSLSKSNALTGLRIGWIVGETRFIEEARKTHAWAVSCADTFAQRVALHVFENGAVREHAAWYAQRASDVVEALAQSGLRFVKPEGAFYAFVRLPDGTPSLDAATRLVDEYDVVAIPGVAFGESGEGWLRLSWVAPVEQFREGLARIKAFCSALTLR